MSKHMTAAADELIEALRHWRNLTCLPPWRKSARRLVAAIDRWEAAYTIELASGNKPPTVGK